MESGSPRSEGHIATLAACSGRPVRASGGASPRSCSDRAVQPALEARCATCDVPPKSRVAGLLAPRAGTAAAEAGRRRMSSRRTAMSEKEAAGVSGWLHSALRAVRATQIPFDRLAGCRPLWLVQLWRPVDGNP